MAGDTQNMRTGYQSPYQSPYQSGLSRFGYQYQPQSLLSYQPQQYQPAVFHAPNLGPIGNLFNQYMQQRAAVNAQAAPPVYDGNIGGEGGGGFGGESSDGLGGDSGGGDGGGGK